MKPKTLLFTGLAMLGVSLIIITAIIFFPSVQRDYPTISKMS
jgi:hypothetical protein